MCARNLKQSSLRIFKGKRSGTKIIIRPSSAVRRIDAVAFYSLLKEKMQYAIRIKKAKEASRLD
jgi:hypothetical protein